MEKKKYDFLCLQAHQNKLLKNKQTCVNCRSPERQTKLLYDLDIIFANDVSDHTWTHFFLSFKILWLSKRPPHGHMTESHLNDVIVAVFTCRHPLILQYSAMIVLPRPKLSRLRNVAWIYSAIASLQWRFFRLNILKKCIFLLYLICVGCKCDAIQYDSVEFYFYEAYRFC